jgi:AraC family transcriptional activator of mtrCDE
MTLAQTAGLSRSAFMARFVSAVGHSPIAALRQLRMKQAAHMLAVGTRSVEQIADAVGYSSRSSFIRAFRHVYGYIPTDSPERKNEAESGTRLQAKVHSRRLLDK